MFRYFGMGWGKGLVFSNVRFRVGSLAVIGAALVVCFQNCSNTRLTRPPDNGQQIIRSSGGDICVAEPAGLTRINKILFIVDMSNSNGTSDPGGVLRMNGLNNLFNSKRADPFTQWGMIVFNGQVYNDDTAAWISSAPLEPIFVPGNDPLNAAIVAGAINKIGTEPTYSQTPYLKPLQLAGIAIDNDIAKDPVQDNYYNMIFLSDGKPTDIDNDGPPMVDPRLDDAIDNLMTKRRGRIFISTGYYHKGGPEADAYAIMQYMALRGHGKFSDFGNGDPIDLSGMVAPGPVKEPWRIKNLLVYNMNSAICEDGAYDRDSDSDGLCDKDEQKYGFDPLKRNSQNPNFGDYFAYRSKVFGEILPNCTLPEGNLDHDMDFLTDCEEAYIFNANPRGVNVTEGNPLNPDTDLDGFIDGIETFVFRSTLGSFVMDSFNMFDATDGESETAGMQVKAHRNPEVYDPTAFQYDTELSSLGVNSAGENCYHFSQDKLLLYQVPAVPSGATLAGLEHGADENVILVYYVQTRQSDPTGQGLFYYSLQKLKTGATASGIKVGPEQFTRYSR